jgi:hypothetical protein
VTPGSPGFLFSIDAEPLAGGAEFWGWQEVSVPIPVGSHLLRWSYSYGTAGESKAWLDQVRFSPAGSAPAITSSGGVAVIGVGGSVVLQAFAQGSPPLAYQWFSNSAPMLGATNSRLSLQRLSAEGAGVYFAQVSNAFGLATNISTVVVSSLPFGEAVEAPDLVWSAGGDPISFVTTNSFITGGSSVELTYQGVFDGFAKRSLLQAVVTGPCTLKFWWKISTQPSHGADFRCSFASDGTGTIEGPTINGDVDWRQETIYLPAGQATVTWAYSDHSWPPFGVAKAWLDKVEVALGATSPLVVVQPRNVTTVSGVPVELSTVVAGTPPFNFQWRRDGTNLIGPGASCQSCLASFPFTVSLKDLSPCSSNVLDCLISNAYGMTNTQSAVVRVLGCFSDPHVQFSCVPSIGSFLNVQGVVRNVVFTNFVVAPYINAWIGWWNKPYWASPTVPIDPVTGQFSFVYTTGGIDHLASSMAVFLIPRDYSPPLVGGGSLPLDAYRNSVAFSLITRLSDTPRVKVEQEAGGQLGLSVEAVPADSQYAIQVTTNLTNARWETLVGSTNIYTNGTQFLLTPPSGGHQLFFRGVCVPCSHP